jgi:nicotinamide mononucleotide adenylyltransferase
MAGLTHISEILVKQGRDFLENLLTREVTISEKLDGSNFNIKKLENNTFEYYKRDGKTPLTDIDRTLSVYFEEPINHFESLSDKVKDSIKPGTFFSFEYFPNNKTVEIYYDDLPPSKLALEVVKLPNGKFVNDAKELNKIADSLQVARPAIIFQGKLNKTQKSKMIEFASTPFEQLIEKYNTQSFSRFIIPLLNPGLKSSFFKRDLDSMIEGIVFNFKGDDGNTFAKLVDPAFTAMAKKKAADRRDKPNNIYGIVISDITDFINNQKLEDYELTAEDFSGRYIELMSDLFFDYITYKGDEYDDINFDTPEFLDRPEHSLNIKNIPNKEVVKLVRSNKNYQELFKMFIASFRKKKKRAYGYFTKEFINKIFNTTVDKIHNYINDSVNEISETDIKSFAILNEDEQISNFGDVEIPVYLQNDSIDESDIITEPGTKKVNVVVGRFQPIHKGHIAISNFLENINGYPSVYITIRGNKPNIKSPISVELQDKLFGDVIKNEKNIEEFLRLPRVLLNEVFTLLRKNGYEPISLGAGSDRVEGYKEQLDFMLTKRENMMNVDPEFEIIETPRVYSGTAIRKSLIDNDTKSFEKMMPKYLHKYTKEIEDAVVQTIEIEDEFNIKDVKLNKEETDGIYDINTIDGKTIIKYNPIIKDSLIKKLTKKYKIK